MFTGKMTRRQMDEEHAEELAKIAAGESRPKPSPEAVRRRERLFVPFAVLTAVVAVLALYFFTAYETTAIATVPPAATGPAFAPLTPTPVASPVGGNQTIGAPMPHPVEGQEQCETCHGPDGMKPQPADHAGRPNESCLVCHKPGAAATAGASGGPAKGIPHAVEGREQCSLCHGAANSLVPLPASHEGRGDQTCQVCHKPAAAGATSEQGMPKSIPHSIAEPIYEDCTTCHGQDKMKPAPANHAGFAADSCTQCHQPSAAGAASGAASESTVTPEAGGAAGGPKAIPHSITEAAYQDCTMCHGAGKLKPAPDNHAGFTVDSCTGCHKPASGAATPEAGTTPEAATTPETGSSSGLVLPKAIPHSITDAAYQDCTMCHGAGKLKPAPDSHANFTVDSCTTCHQPAQQ
jgi:hypothetical protein